MRTSRNIQFKNKAKTVEAYYDCILSCEINPCSSSWQGIKEDCEAKCLNQNLKSHFM